MAHLMLSAGKMTQEGYRNITECHIGKGVPFLHLHINYFYVAVAADFPT